MYGKKEYREQRKYIFKAQIYMVKFTVYSFTRFNHLLYIAIYHI